MRVAALLLLVSLPAWAVEPHRSASALPSSNGRATIVFDGAKSRLTTFLEHPYRYPRPNVETRNFLFDMYPGLRVGAPGTAGKWLAEVPPATLGYVPGTGIIEATRAVSGLSVEEYDFTPMSLGEPAFVSLLHIHAGAASQAVSAYALVNLHLGAGAPAPTSDGEGIQYNAARDAFYEYGPAGVAIGYGSLAPSTHHTAPPSNPYPRLVAGQDLDDANGRDGWSDAVGGFQSDLGALASGGDAWLGWYVVLAPDAKAQEAVDRVKAWMAGRSAKQLFDDERADWNAWAPLPGPDATEQDLARAQAGVVLRMAQVKEQGKAHGQLLASLPPGQWNIAWVRDMAYATVALVRTGHLAEAREALEFQVNASAGTYRIEAGGDYRLSVCRYFGEGIEESDSNEHGPNIEFDGFGLFLWALDEYAKAGGDVSALWPAARDGVADVLLRLQEASGLVAADSSIWETHWDGQQKHFAYTTITAAKGLDAAAHLAQAAEESSRAQAYRAAAAKARDAVAAQLRTEAGVLVQSTEALAAGSKMLDAAVLEALNFGLFRADGQTAAKTVEALRASLTVPSQHGLQRNEWGGWYDQQEWVFVDLRLASALVAANRPEEAQALSSWVTHQALSNFGLFAELFERDTADCAGAVPMVGFGAGAYLLYLEDAADDSPRAPIAGQFAREPNHAPALTVTGPQEIPADGVDTITVAVTDPDDGDLAAGVRVSMSVDGGAPEEKTVGASPATFQVGPLPSGVHALSFVATDRWGATKSAEFRLTVDEAGDGRPPAGCSCGSLEIGAISLVGLVARRRRVRPLC